MAGAVVIILPIIKYIRIYRIRGTLVIYLFYKIYLIIKNKSRCDSKIAISFLFYKLTFISIKSVFFMYFCFYFGSSTFIFQHLINLNVYFVIFTS